MQFIILLVVNGVIFNENAIENYNYMYCFAQEGCYNFFLNITSVSYERICHFSSSDFNPFIWISQKTSLYTGNRFLLT